MNCGDCFRKHVCHTEHLYFTILAVLRLIDRVRRDELTHDRFLDTLTCVTAQYAVGTGGEDIYAAGVLQCLAGFDYGPRRIDFIVDNEAVFVGHITYDAQNLGFLVVTVSAFVEDNHRQVEHPGEAFRAFRGSRIGCGDDEVVHVLIVDVVAHQMPCNEMVDWYAAETDYLRGMEVHG